VEDFTKKLFTDTPFYPFHRFGHKDSAHPQPSMKILRFFKFMVFRP